MGKTAASSSTNLQKAVNWLSEVVQDHPEKERKVVLKEAQIRFDLTPAESTFLSEKFSGKSSDVS